ESHIDVALSASRITLGVQRINTRSGRNAVQRHVDDRRDPASCRRAPCRIEALPGGSAGFVDLHVRIHETGNHDRRARIHDLGSHANIVIFAECDDDAVVDLDGGWTHTGGEDDALPAYDKHQRRREDTPSLVSRQNWATRFAATRRRYSAVERMSSMGAMSASIARCASATECP